MPSVVTITSTIPGLVIGSDGTGVPVRLTIGSNRVPEDVWRSWLVANYASRLVSDGAVRRVER